MQIQTQKRTTMTVKSEWLRLLKKRKKEKGIWIIRSLEDIFDFAEKHKELWY
jgi:hypothetical protein